MYPKLSSSNSNSSTPEPDRPQHDRAPSCVFSLHYSLTTFFSLRFHSRKRETERDRERERKRERERRKKKEKREERKEEIFSRFRNIPFSFIYFLENFLRLKFRYINCVCPRMYVFECLHTFLLPLTFLCIFR